MARSMSTISHQHHQHVHIHQGLANMRLSEKEMSNFLLISRATNLQSCEMLRTELTHTLQNCDKALGKLNEHIANLKSQKAFKDVQFYFNQLQQHRDESLDRNSNSNSNVSGFVFFFFKF